MAMPKAREERHGGLSMRFQCAAGAIAAVWQASEVEISSPGLTGRPPAAVFEVGHCLLPTGVRTSRGPVDTATVDLDGRSRPPLQSLALALHRDGGSKCRSNRGLDELADHVVAKGGRVCSRAFAIAQEFLAIGHWQRMACVVLEGIMRPTTDPLLYARRAGEGDHT